MAAGNTKDTRVHVMGDMTMITGTFTDGGIDVSYADQLSTVFAAGGHLTSITATPVLAAEAEAAAAGSTALTVDTVGLLVAFVDNDVLCRLGARKAGVTLLQNAIEVSVDETNQFVVFEAGSQTATQTTNTADGRWWILGQR